MATYSFKDVFDPKTVAAMVEKIKAGLPRPLPDAAYASSRFVSGNQATFGQLYGSRRTARVTAFGSPSAASAAEKIGRQTATLIHSAEHFRVRPDEIGMGMAWADQIGDLGVQEYTRRLSDLKQRFINLRTTAVHLAITTGYVYWDSSGNVLPSSSGAQAGVDYGISSNNKDQLADVDGNTIIDASWATAATNIQEQVEEIITTGLQRTGQLVDTCIYGAAIPGYLTANTSAANLINGNAAYAQAFGNGSIPSGLFGITNWIPGNRVFYIDADGDYQTLVGADTAIFCPAFAAGSGGWYEVIDGTEHVPTTLGGGAGTDPLAALASFVEQRGMYAYPEVTTDPAGLKTVVGDTFLPLIQVPDSLFIADVTP